MWTLKESASKKYCSLSFCNCVVFIRSCEVIGFRYEPLPENLVLHGKSKIVFLRRTQLCFVFFPVASDCPSTLLLFLLQSLYTTAEQGYLVKEGNAAEGTSCIGEGTAEKYSLQNPVQLVVAWKQLKHTV